MKANKLTEVVREVKTLLDRGVWVPDILFAQLTQRYRRLHYATIRKAIHIAKTEIYK